MLGLQDLEGLKVVYREDGANEILSGCDNKSFLRISNPATSRWAQQNFEEKEETERDYSRTTGGKDETKTEAEHIVTRPLYSAADFRNLLYPELGFLEGIHDIPITGRVTKTTEAFSTVLSMLDPASPDTIQNEDPRDANDQKFVPWTTEEESAFLCTGTPPNQDNPLGGLKPRKPPRKQ